MGKLKWKWVRNKEWQLDVEFKAGVSEKLGVVIQVVKQY